MSVIRVWFFESSIYDARLRYLIHVPRAFEGDLLVRERETGTSVAHHPIDRIRCENRHHTGVTFWMVHRTGDLECCLIGFVHEKLKVIVFKGIMMIHIYTNRRKEKRGRIPI